MLIVGYGDEAAGTDHCPGKQYYPEGHCPYWIVKNSWGAGWGVSQRFPLYTHFPPCKIHTV